jgi:methanogenic corrinoid protein MtbC1
MLHISIVEQNTGISKDLLRKWESRYGFPVPQRRQDGDRYYPREQVERLRTIKRLLDAGYRAHRVVPADSGELRRLADGLGRPASQFLDPAFVECLLDALASFDVLAVERLLKSAYIKNGVQRFVLDILAPMNVVVGDAWASGRLQIHHERAYTETVVRLMHTIISGLEGQADGRLRILLATPSGELHTLGLLMAQAMFMLEGAQVVMLGQQVPFSDLVAAASRYRADVLGLSFSHAYSLRIGRLLLEDLRSELDPAIQIIAGGSAVGRYGKLPEGVFPSETLSAGINLIVALRGQRHAATRV